MNKNIKQLLDITTKYAQSVGFQAADIQVALGQSEQDPSQNRGYYAKSSIDGLVTDITNKFNLDDNTNGKIDITCTNGSISFITTLTNQKELQNKITMYLKIKYSADMAKKIQAYCAIKHIPVGSAVASWISF